ncbi:uncharacterized protein TNCV_919461 [Trichonephila clavipes]|nr:uncharacterized protein TNCV_919461 [Trichonephila clavipes]
MINTDFVNHPVPLTIEPSKSLVHVGTDACKSIINHILRYKDYKSHKNDGKDLQKRFVDNPFGHECLIYDRLWFRDDLRTPVSKEKNILLGINLEDIKSCYNWRRSLNRAPTNASPFSFPNCWGKSCVNGWSKILTPVPTDSPRDEKGCRIVSIDPVSHRSETTLRLEKIVPTMRRERQRILRGRKSRDQGMGVERQ